MRKFFLVIVTLYSVSASAFNSGNVAAFLESVCEDAFIGNAGGVAWCKKYYFKRMNPVMDRSQLIGVVDQWATNVCGQINASRAFADRVNCNVHKQLLRYGKQDKRKSKSSAVPSAESESSEPSGSFGAEEEHDPAPDTFN